MKQVVAFKFIPVIMLTTEGSANMKEVGKAAGAAGWMTKPFKPEQLLSVARKFVRA